MTTILDRPGTNPPNPFLTHIQAVLTDPSSAPEAATRIVAAVSASPNPADALWQLWDVFFAAAAAAPSAPPSHHHQSLLALLDALRSQPPTYFGPLLDAAAARALRSYTDADDRLDWAALPRFGAQWRDVHDILQVWRDWDGVRAGDGNAQNDIPSPEPVGPKYLSFCAFSAAVVAARRHSVVGVHVVWVFFACRDALESAGPATDAASEGRSAHRVPPDQVWALDVRIAATWMRDGGRALFETSEEELRRHWAAALEEKTDYWPRKDGLTRDRWRVWVERLRALSAEGQFDEETRAVTKEAAKIAEGFLKGSGES
jgi:Protein of unknown function (DUF3632)